MELIINFFIWTWQLWLGLVVLIAIVSLLRMYGGGRARRLPYHKRERIVTNAELRFYRSLQRAVQDDWEIFAMVRLADLLRVDEGATNKRSWVGKILAKHCDFVLCDPSTLSPVMGIELDDSSHQRKDRIERDAFVDHAFESADLPLLRVPVRSKYHAREVRELIDDLLG